MKEYYLAALEYERSLFHKEQPTLSNEILLKKTRCLKALKRYEDGYKNLLRADLYSNSDSLNFILRYELVINAYLSESYDIAHNHIQQLNHFIISDQLKLKVAFLEILTLNELMKWKDAKDKLISYNELMNTNFNIDSLYYFVDKPKIRDIQKTEKLAIVAPGFIQLREGKPLDWFVSASIRGSLIYLLIDQFTRNYFFSGAFSATALYFIFYQGAAKYAIELTKKKNKKKIQKYNQRIKHALIAYEMSIINNNLNGQN